MTKPVKDFHKASLKGCDECADFAALGADMVVGNIGSEPGTSTVLLRTDAGMEAWVKAAGAFEDAPIEDLGAVKRLALKNLDRAKKNLKRDLRPRRPVVDQLHRAPRRLRGDRPRGGQSAAVPIAPLHGGLLAMAPFGFPVLLELSGRRCVVIGALPVREGKVEALVAGGATDVLVVADEPAARLDGLEGLDGVVVARRAWTTADVQGAFLVIAHDPDPHVRARLAIAARAAGALVNVVDDIPALRLGDAGDRAPGRTAAGDRHRRRLARPRTQGPRASRGRVRPRMGRGAAGAARGARGDDAAAARLRGARRGAGARRSTPTRRRRWCALATWTSFADGS